MPSLEFTCKDPLVVAHYEKVFGDRFRSDLENLPAPEEWEYAYRTIFSSLMATEARRQGHYDYEIDARGQRSPIFIDGIPKLLVPGLVITR